MDTSSFNDYRERIGTTLATRLNDAYAQGAVSQEESPVVAQFILDKIDTLNNHEELMAFLEELANKWPVFGPVLVLERSMDSEEKNSETVNQAEQLIKENKIEEALALVENTDENTQEGGTN